VGFFIRKKATIEIFGFLASNKCTDEMKTHQNTPMGLLLISQTTGIDYYMHPVKIIN